MPPPSMTAGFSDAEELLAHEEQESLAGRFVKKAKPGRKVFSLSSEKRLYKEFAQFDAGKMRAYQCKAIRGSLLRKERRNLL